MMLGRGCWSVRSDAWPGMLECEVSCLAGDAEVSQEMIGVKL